ncbi:MAG: CARDB domain-containing protein [Phycisphaerales bacterium]
MPRTPLHRRAGSRRRADRRGHAHGAPLIDALEPRLVLSDLWIETFYLSGGSSQLQNREPGDSVSIVLQLYPPEFNGSNGGNVPNSPWAGGNLLIDLTMYREGGGWEQTSRHSTTIQSFFTTLATSLTLPNGILDGTYRVRATLDPTNAWFESNEGNNVGNTSNVFTVLNGTEPDLAASITQPSGPAASPGGSLVIPFSIPNNGTDDAGPSTARFVLSSDQTIGNADDVTIATQAVPALSPGQSFGGEYTATVPASLGAGTWYAGVIADAENAVAESNENNNTAITAQPVIEVAAPTLPDLVVTILDSSPRPATIRGVPFTVTYRVDNLGGTPSGATNNNFFLPGDPFNWFLGAADVPALTAGQSYTNTITLTVPSDLSPGAYPLGSLVDVNNLVSESNESNNETITAETIVNYDPNAKITVDLEAFYVEGPTSVVQPGHAIGLLGVVRNNGTQDAPAVPVRYVLTTDSTIGNADDVEFYSGGSLLATAGQLGYNDVFFTLPQNPGIPSGTYYVALIVDPDDIYPETDESNNVVLSDLSFQFVNPSPPPPPPATNAEINVLGGAMLNQSLTHLDKARRSQGTGFGPVERDADSKDITFRITNSGADPLIITDIEPRGQVPGDYQIIAYPASTIAPGGHTEFVVRFDPSEYGTRRANIAIFTNDPDRNRFTMKVAGRGVPDPALPDIAVTAGSRDISDNDRKARANTGQRYGVVDIGQRVFMTYTITNAGGTTLLLGDIVVDYPAWRIVQRPLDTSLSPGESTTFLVEFTAMGPGKAKGMIYIDSSDPDEFPFNFRVIGTGI